MCQAQFQMLYMYNICNSHQIYMYLISIENTSYLRDDGHSQGAHNLGTHMFSTKLRT